MANGSRKLATPLLQADHPVAVEVELASVAATPQSSARAAVEVDGGDSGWVAPLFPVDLLSVQGQQP